MTTPASGAISLNDVKTETASATGTSPSMSWVKDNTRKTVGTTPVPPVTDLDTVHNKAWYKSTMGGNCNNGNCTTGQGNCGDRNCANCYNTALANCVNCDTQNYLQPNCNCACTYNCNSNSVTVNCACACWICACACW